jgi:succinate dehydrogenase hydrophobic anchor subunit
MKKDCEKRVKSERHAFFLLSLSILAVAWWVSIWGLLEEYVDWAKDRFKVDKHTIYLSMLIFVVLVVFIFPELLDKI